MHFILKKCAIVCSRTWLLYPNTFVIILCTLNLLPVHYFIKDEEKQFSICELHIVYLISFYFFALNTNQLLSHLNWGQIDLHYAELSHSLYK